MDNILRFHILILKIIVSKLLRIIVNVCQININNDFNSRENYKIIKY
jgi:hypothetical protein